MFENFYVPPLRVSRSGATLRGSLFARPGYAGLAAESGYRFASLGWGNNKFEASLPLGLDFCSKYFLQFVFYCEKKYLRHTIEKQITTWITKSPSP